jgi:GNAT superfamily N-acetyltransferase
MKSEISPYDIIIEKIEENHDITCFDCVDHDLNEFLKNDAKFQMKSKINVTYVCKYDKKIIAFFTLANDAIKINPRDKKRIGIKYPDFPALKIGRLAVDRRYERKGFGTLIIYWVAGLAQECSKYIGVRFISVDSYKDSRTLYDKNQFVELDKEQDGNIPMYCDLEWLV